MAVSHWVVEFGCREAVVRTGAYEQVDHSDDLGCPVTRIRPLGEVGVSALWEKDGELRCELANVH